MLPRTLTVREIEKKLRRLDGWRHQGRFLTKTFEFDEFMEGISFLNKVARVAERQQHHPDIRVRYTRISLSIQTHSEGDVTSWDFELAKAIDEIKV